MDSLPGYQLLGRISSGGTGTVWKGQDSELGREVAIKEIATRDADAVSRIRSEAKVLATLAHQNIVQVFGIVEQTDRIWLVEEWIDGASLSKVARPAGRLTAQQSVGLLRGALQGLAYAHGTGVVHGDISPGNILVDRAGVSKLVDFGLATALADGRQHPVGTARTARSATGPAGTPGYASPEALTGGTVGTSADVFSCAAVLVELLTTQPVTSDPQVSPSAGILRRRGIAPDIATVLARSLNLQPADRQANASELLAELEEAAERSYGPGWIGAASVTTVVASVLAAGSAAVIAPATPAGTTTSGSATTTQVGTLTAAERVESAAAQAVSLSSSAGTKAARPWWIAGVGAAVAVAVVIGLIFVINRQEDPVTPVQAAADIVSAATAPAATNTSSSAPVAPTPGTVASSVSSSVASASNPAAAFSGTYAVVTTITQVTGENAGDVGQQIESTWTASVPAYCQSAAVQGCLIRVTTTEDDVLGGGINFSYADGQWTAKWMPSLACGTGGSVTGTLPASSEGSLSSADAGSAPANSLTGTMVTRADGLTCGGAEPPEVQYSLALTRTGG